MDVIIIMSVGILFGLKFFPKKYNKYNNIIQTITIMLTIFCMGVGLGSSPTFIKDLLSAGGKSVVFALVPILFSVIVVYALTSIFLKETTPDNCTPQESDDTMESKL